MAADDPTSTQSPATTHPTWLVMVYMQAGDTSQLDNLAIQDLVEMEAGVRGNPHVQVLVQIQRRWPAVPQRYLLRASGLPEMSPGPDPTDRDLLNMGTSKALEDFLSAGRLVGEKSEVKKYCLVLWGHAFGLGFGRDHNDALELHELEKALAAFRIARGDRRLDILATNTCTMSYIEAAYQLKDDVEYLAASQVFVPLTGLPYKSILASIDSMMAARLLGRLIVDHYVRQFTNSPRGERVAMTLLHLAQAAQFADSLESLASAITAVVGTGQETDFQRLSEIQDVFFANPAGEVRPVLDLCVLARDLSDLSDDLIPPANATAETVPEQRRTEDHDRKTGRLRALQQRANDLTNAIDGDSVEGQEGEPGGVNDERSTPLVVWHNEHDSLKELHGLGVFAPFVVDKHVRKQLEIDDLKRPESGDFDWREIDDLKGIEYDDLKGRAAYERLKIFQGRRSWPKLVYDLLRREEPDEIVDATGVVLPAERLQVNQLVVAVEAAFNKLDRVLESAERQLVSEVVERRAIGATETLAAFGPPKLALAGDWSLTNSAQLLLSSEAPSQDEPPQPQADATRYARRVQSLDGRIPIVSTLARIEQAVHLVETTTKRVVTNRTFGLGPPSSKAPNLMHLGPKPAGEVLGPKPAGEVLGPKPAGEVLGPKPAGEVLGPKPAGEVLGPLGSETGAILAWLSSDAQMAGLAVSTLLTQIAFALTQLERAAAAIESAAAQFSFTPMYGALLPPKDYKAAVRLRFAEQFGVMKEVSLQARRSIRRILAHPLYGLGPGPEGLEQEDRDELTAAAGLSRRNLRLL